MASPSTTVPQWTLRYQTMDVTVRWYVQAKKATKAAEYTETRVISLSSQVASGDGNLSCLMG